jgi:hypothetical protein
MLYSISCVHQIYSTSIENVKVQEMYVEYVHYSFPIFFWIRSTFSWHYYDYGAT